MIQRIQSLYLLSVFLISVALFFISFGTAGEYNFTIFKITNGENVISTTYGVTILSAVGGLLAFITIFLYKNRKLQMRLCKIGLFVQALLVGAAFFYLDAAVKKIPDVSEANYGIGTILPLISLILCFLADKAILKDDKLVRSVDRIR